MKHAEADWLGDENMIFAYNLTNCEANNAVLSTMTDICFFSSQGGNSFL